MIDEQQQQSMKKDEICQFIDGIGPICSVLTFIACVNFVQAHSET